MLKHIENSPVFHARHVDTPLLIQFGDEDEAVPWQQGIELYLALRRLDQDVVFLQYRGEPHHLQRYPNKLDCSIKMKRFFEHHLKDAPMRIAIVTETFPPEVNGVALTLERLARGLAGRGHRVEVVRPRQRDEARSPAPPWGALLVRGLPLPDYPGLMFGLPAGGRLRDRWRHPPPDVVHVVTEGPLGWSAVRAARRLGLRSVRASTPTSTATAATTAWGRLGGWPAPPAGRPQPHRPHAGALGHEVRQARRSGLSFGTMRRTRPGLKLVLVGDGPERRALQDRHPDFHFAGH